MLSKTAFRASLQALRRASRPTLSTLEAYQHPPWVAIQGTSRNQWFSYKFPRRFPPPPPRYPRNIHIKYDPEAAQRARPLLTTDQVSNVFTSRSSKWIMIVAVGGAGVFYVSNLEEVPVSGRRRFNCYSEDAVEQQGDIMYRKIMADAGNSILPSWDPRAKMVDRVMKRLIPASGLEHVNWEVYVIHSPEKNAFVIPGGKVFVYSGILPIAKTDDGLAAILGHEIAHNLAQHAAESMSSLVMLSPIRWALIFLDATGYTGGLGRIAGDIAMDFGLMRPASRKQESEADYIGLMMMAKACYDPNAAVGVWQRMEAAQKDQIPQWLSTHPSNAFRIENMEKWVPKAETVREESDCAVTLGYSKDFNDRLGGWRGFGIMR